ncbi:uncharacterized protein [Arachis hypogaea]|uniref:uncharacterized protein n=1 Tax=Arachis hypogaea TaxID=3818 RepID=UPI003B2169F6
MAKEIWDKLRLTHEGTKQVKETRIDMLMKEYEMFSMKKDESINQMFERFSIIINNLDAMGRNYSKETLVRKILRSLTKKWEVKSTTISERNDLIKITYDELRGKLLAYETTHMSQYKDDKKKSIVLKSRMTAQGEESDDSFSDEEMVLFARKMRRLLRHKSKSKGSSSCKDVKKDQVKFTCHHCREPGHFKSDFPQRKKGEKSKKYKKKVMMATWEDLENDTSSESSDQEAQLCLMADHNEEDEVSLASKKKMDMWYLDSGCSRHMTGRDTFFIKLNKLKHNLLSVSQLCDLGYAITFRKSDCRVINEKIWAVLFVAKRSNNVYGITLDDLKVQNVTCFSSMEFEKWMWHKRLGYASMFQISKLVKRGLVRDLPNIKFEKDIICDACQMAAPEPIYHLVHRLFARLDRIERRNKRRYENVKLMIRSSGDIPSEPDTPFDTSEVEEDDHEEETPTQAAQTGPEPAAPQQEGPQQLQATDTEIPIHPGFEAEAPKNNEPVPQNPSSHEVAPVSSKNSNSAGDNLELSPVAAENTDAEAIVDQEEPESSTQIKRPREWKFLKNYPEKFINSDPSKIYVDDIIFGSTNEDLCADFAKLLTNEFDMSMMGELNFFLGLQIKQTAEGIFIRQEKYAKELVKKFGLDCAKPMGTPMHPNIKLDKDEHGRDVDETRYRGMIGSLMYLTSSRPDIIQSVGVCSRFQSKAKESHLSAVKRIIRYVLGTTNYGLWFPKTDSFQLVGFCDTDFAGDRIDRRSTSGMCCFLGKFLIVWSSKKQATVALSTAKAEYIAASSCCSQLLWLKTQLADYKLNVSNILLFCDNMSAINISKNPVLHSRTKHIEVHFHSIREHVQNENLDIQFVNFKGQLADIFTKPLIEERFCKLRTELGILTSSLFS